VWGESAATGRTYYGAIMNVQRYYVPNAMVFLTQVVDRREPIFQEERYVLLLRTVLRNVKELHPFVMVAYVFLPDHFHLLIRTTASSTFSDVMHSLKYNFTREYKQMIGVAGSMHFWQKSFWDHVIRDEQDLQNHLGYIHYNPVHHKLVTRPEAWLHSSYCEWQKRGAYPLHWGWSLPDVLKDTEKLSSAHQFGE